MPAFLSCIPVWRQSVDEIGRSRRAALRRFAAAGAALAVCAPRSVVAAVTPPDTGITVVANRTALSMTDPARLPTPAVVLMAGWHRPADGGGGSFIWVPDSTEAPDDVLVMRSAVSDTGRWIRDWSGGRISPEMAGAIGDGATDDRPAFDRLVAASQRRGAFTIALTTGKHYYLHDLLDMSIGAPGLTMEGPAAAQRIPGRETEALVTRVELEPSTGATIKLGDSQAVRNVLVWRHGLATDPTSLGEIRDEVARWFAEDGTQGKRSIGLWAPFTDVTIDGVTVIGFHTGILATGGRFKIRHCLIDAAGAGVEAHGSKDTSLIEDVQVRGQWSFKVPGKDEYGDQGYRLGTAFYVHDSADGLQINSVMAIGWVTGLWLHGTRTTPDWLISVLQPDIETPGNNGRVTAAIRTTGSVRRITIIDPRIVFGGVADGPCAGLDFGHDDPDRGAAANDNVTVIGGAIEVANKQGIAILIRAGSNGLVSDTTLAGNGLVPLVKMLAGSGRWAFDHVQLRGPVGANWLSVDASATGLVSVDGVTVSDR